MARQVRVEILGDARSLHRAFDSAERRASSFGRGLGRIGGALAGAFAGVAVIEGIKGFVDQAREAQAVSKQTAAVIKSTGGAAKLSAKGFTDLASSISKKVVVDDDLIQGGENILATFTNVRNEVGRGNDIFNQASAAAVDLAAAMNHGEVSAEGLQSANIQLGKALNDPVKGITALTRVGVSFTSQQKDQIKSLVASGRTLDAQKIIIGELTKEFGGAAASQATAAKRLGVAWGNIQEQLGNVLIPILDKVATWLSGVLPGAIGVAQRVLGNLGRALHGVFDLLVRGDFTGNFARAFNVEEDAPIVARLLRIHDGIAGVANLLVHGKFTEQFAKAFGVTEDAPIVDRLLAIRDTIGEVARKFAGLPAAVAAMIGSLASAVQKATQPIIDALTAGLRTGDYGPLGRAIGNALVNALQGASDLIGRIVGWVRQQFDKIDWETVGKTVGKTVIPFAVGLMATLADGLITSAREHPLDTVLFVASFLAIGKIGQVIGRILRAIPILRWFAPLFEGIARLTKPINDAIGRVFGAMGRAALRGLGLEGVPILRGVVRLFDGIRLRIWFAAEAIGRAALRVIEFIFRGIRAGVVLVIRAIGEVLAPIGRFLARLLGPVAALARRAGATMLERLVAGLRSVFGSIGRAIADVLASIGRFLARLLGPVAGGLRRAGAVVLERLVAGLRSVFGAISRAISDTIGRVRDPFARAASWLVDAGRNVVAGLRAGIDAAIGTVGGVLGRLKDAIVGGLKRLFGIRSPSTVMAGIGSNLVAGLVKGLVTNVGNLRGVVRTIGGGLLDWLGGVLGFVGGIGGPAGPRGDVVKLGQAMAAQRGWVGSMWEALYSLWQAESGWNPQARNAASGAFGIPQALPASKMGPAGAAGNAAAQIQWGLGYIAERYGNPLRAWAAWQSRVPHWYAAGGTVNGPGTARSDSVPIMASRGEFVVNARQATRFLPVLQAINSGVARFANGGLVTTWRRWWGHKQAGFAARDLHDPHRGRPGWVQLPSGAWGHAGAALLHRWAQFYLARHAGRRINFADVLRGYRLAEDMSLVPASFYARRVRTISGRGWPVRWGAVSQATWNRLLAAGWRGRPNDRMEALYPPGRFSAGGLVSRFDRGGWLPPGFSLAYNGTGRPEPVGAAGIDYDRLAAAIVVAHRAAGPPVIRLDRRVVSEEVQYELNRRRR